MKQNIIGKAKRLQEQTKWLVEAMESGDMEETRYRIKCIEVYIEKIEKSVNRRDNK